MVPQPLPLEIEMALVTPVLNVLLLVELQVAIVLLGILTKFQPSIFGKLTKKSYFINFFRFGVCCLFTYSTSGTTIKQNCSYIQNPGFPSVYTTTTALTYKVSKLQSGMYD